MKREDRHMGGHGYTPRGLELGKSYRDTVTGFEGVATGRFEYLHGCIRWQLTRAGKEDGKPVDCVFDEPALEPVEAPQVADLKMGGGPRETPAR